MAKHVFFLLALLRGWRLGALDPGAGSWFKMCWDLCGVCFQLYYITSIVDELARARQRELDEIALARLEQEDKEVR